MILRLAIWQMTDAMIWQKKHAQKYLDGDVLTSTDTSEANKKKIRRIKGIGSAPKKKIYFKAKYNFLKDRSISMKTLC